MQPESKSLATTFAVDGFVVMKQLWSPAEADEVERELERFLVECVPKMDKVHRTFTDGWEGEVKSLGALDLYDPYFKELGNHELMQETASALLGEEAVFTAFEYFSRPPHSDAIGPYHQDNGYFCYEPPHEASGIHGFSQRLVDSDEQLRDYPEIAGVLPRGGCTIHHCLTAHRSGPNTTNSRRRAIVADYKTAGAEESKSLRAKLERERDELLRRVAERANATEAADQ